MRAASILAISLAAASAACSSNPAPATTAPQPAAATPAATPAPAAPAPAPAAATPAAAPAAAIDLSGSWGIALDVQGQTIAVDVSLTRGPNGYTGEAAPQGQTAAPLAALTIQGDRVTMTFNAPDGEAVFSGQLTADRRSMTGTLAYNGQSLPFTMTKR